MNPHAEPLRLEINVNLAPEAGRAFASGAAKRAAIDTIDAALDRELGAVRAWNLVDGVVAVAPLPLVRREYSMDAWSVQVRVVFDPRQMPKALCDMGQARAVMDEQHLLCRWGNRLLLWLFGKRAVTVIEQAQAMRAEQYTHLYAHAVATMALACSGQEALAAIHKKNTA